MIITRFAPSPTGELHIGGARTALFNYLFARSEHDGKFILRIDDTDLERSKKCYEEKLLHDLKWLGLDWNEGPYRQSERGEIYSRYIEELKASAMIYPCFCSDERLNAMRSAQLSRGEAPKYDGHCRNLSCDEIQSRINSGERPCWRLRLPEDYEVEFNDVVRGTVTFPANTIGDFVIQRSDGTPTYVFASAVDDHVMQISHIIRGDEHIPNTARQVLILEAMNWNRPIFVHIPMVLSQDGQKLSKRTGSIPIREYRERGFYPEALNAYLSTLSIRYDEELDLLNISDVSENFSLERIAVSSPVHDEGHLLYWQKKFMLQRFHDNPDEIISSVINHDNRLGMYRDNLALLINEILGDVPFINDICTKLSFLVEVPECDVNFSWSREIVASLSGLTDWTPENVNTLLRTFMKSRNLKGREFFHPLRIILTGQESGAPLPLIMYILGRDECIRRLMKS